MSGLKTFLVSDSHDTFFVVLEVDTAVLTAEKAHRINAYWGGALDRLDAEDGDAVRAVVRQVGCKLIGAMLENGGNTFDERGATTPQPRGRFWMLEMKEREGVRWDEGGPIFGIRLVKADVEPPGFEEMDLDEQVVAV